MFAPKGRDPHYWYLGTALSSSAWIALAAIECISVLRHLL